MKLVNVMVAWTPRGTAMDTAGLVTVGEHPDRTGWSARFMHAVGARDAEFVSASDTGRLAVLYKAFVVMTVRDRIRPEWAHEALLAIEEYQKEIGAEVEETET